MQRYTFSPSASRLAYRAELRSARAERRKVAGETLREIETFELVHGFRLASADNEGRAGTRENDEEKVWANEENKECFIDRDDILDYYDYTEPKKSADGVHDKIGYDFTGDLCSTLSKPISVQRKIRSRMQYYRSLRPAELERPKTTSSTTRAIRSISANLGRISADSMEALKSLRRYTRFSNKPGSFACLEPCLLPKALVASESRQKMKRQLKDLTYLATLEEKTHLMNEKRQEEERQKDLRARKFDLYNENKIDFKNIDEKRENILWENMIVGGKGTREQKIVGKLQRPDRHVGQYNEVISEIDNFERRNKLGVYSPW